MRGFFAALRMTSNGDGNGKGNSNGKGKSNGNGNGNGKNKGKNNGNSNGNSNGKNKGKSNGNSNGNGNRKSDGNRKSNGVLFGSQGLHGVDCGGVAGWKQAGEDSDSNECQDGCADDNGVVGTYFEEHASYYAGRAKCDSNSGSCSYENGH